MERLISKDSECIRKLSRMRFKISSLLIYLKIRSLVNSFPSTLIF
jgi:hypothetical protein